MRSLVSEKDLVEILNLRHENPNLMGWAPRTRRGFNYFTPDEYYEAWLNNLVTVNCTWLDVGCGRNIFPGNPNLARVLAKRCGLLVGVDPDLRIEENTLVHRRVVGRIEDSEGDCQFDVVTLRMVAEHIGEPDQAVSFSLHLGSRAVFLANCRSPGAPLSGELPTGGL